GRTCRTRSRQRRTHRRRPRWRRHRVRSAQAPAERRHHRRRNAAPHGCMESTCAAIQHRCHGQVRSDGFVGGSGRGHDSIDEPRSFDFSSCAREDTMKLTGAEILCETLTHLNVKHVFGYPGGAILPVYDAIGKSKLHHILVRHEQGATHMADGYARASGGIGVAMATSGPGATNMVTGIATAMLDSSPVVCITGQVSSKVLGTDAFQEVDITGITMPITKHNVVVTKAEEVARTLRE